MHVCLTFCAVYFTVRSHARCEAGRFVLPFHKTALMGLYLIETINRRGIVKSEFDELVERHSTEIFAYVWRHARHASRRAVCLVSHSATALLSVSLKLISRLPRSIDSEKCGCTISIGWLAGSELSGTYVELPAQRRLSLSDCERRL